VKTVWELNVCNTHVITLLENKLKKDLGNCFCPTHKSWHTTKPYKQTPPKEPKHEKLQIWFQLGTPTLDCSISVLSGLSLCSNNTTTYFPTSFLDRSNSNFFVADLTYAQGIFLNLSIP
jgi:hypothetical protein